jgi:toxin FitB
VRGWLIDTNVVSELRRPKPNPRVTAFVSGQPGHTLFTSVVTFAEIRFGIEATVDVARRLEIGEWLENTVRPFFGSRVVEIDEDVLLQWRLLLESGRKSGHTFAQPDLFIAATAVMSQLIVVSRDISEFVAAKVPVLDPWNWVLHAGGKAIPLPDCDQADTLQRAIKANR